MSNNRKGLKMSTNSKKLNLIAEKIRKCTKCQECDRSNPAPGNGNPEAKCLLLGEAQGQRELEEGKVFVGKAGQLLSNIITACGLDRDKDLFILNILKCRPPNNRTPTPEEAKNCRPFLDLQLKVISPKFIMCLGACAAQNLLGEKTPITYMRGKWYDYNGAKVLCTFHPSFLLRQPDRKKDAWEDWQMLLREAGLQT